MNLHSIVSGIVGAINPPVPCTVRVSAGYTIGADGSQIPEYTTATNVPVQLQALTYTDLMKLGGMNIQGNRKAAYLNGNIQGLNRAALKGGDLFTFPDGTTWLVAQVLENWPDWTKCALTQQVSP